VKVFFPIAPICRFLSKQSRTELMNDVNRDSINNKIMGLLNASSKFFNEMEHFSKLS